MAVKKEEKIIITPLKSGSYWFVNYTCYALTKEEEIVWIAGGGDTLELRTALEQYIQVNNKKYEPREPSIIGTTQKEYNEIFTFGKYNGSTVTEIFHKDKSYLKFMVDKITDVKLKKEVEEILK